MGRKSTFATGGGFLNEVDATITAYRFTDDFVDPNGVVYEFDPTKKFKDGKGKMQPVPHGINIVLSLLVDGAEEPVTQCLRIATDYDKWSISDDEQSLTPVVDGARLGGSSAGGKFIQSWEAAAKDGAMSEDESVINFAPIVGPRRVRLVQRDYTAAEIESIKKLGGSEKRKGKDGKEYARQSLCVDQVYEQAEAEVKANGKLKTPPVNQAKPLGSKTGGATRPTKMPTTSPSEDIDIKEVAGAALVEIIGRVGKNGLLDKRKLSVQTLMTPLLKGKPYRDDVQKFLFNDDNLLEFASEGIAVGDTAYDVTFDKVKQTIQVEAQ